MVQADPRPTILVNLGDHDDSGIEIMRDTHNSIEELSNQSIKTQRLAVLPGHVDEFDLATRMIEKGRPHADAEARLDQITLLNDGPVYDEDIGHFDLDAMDPNVSRDLVRDFLHQFPPAATLDRIRARERREQRQIDKLARHWPTVERMLRNLK